MPEVPIVVGDANPGWASARRRLRVEPVGESLGRGASPLDVRVEPGRSCAGEAGAEPLELRALRAHTPGAVHPQIVARSDQVLPRLGEERRDRLERGPIAARSPRRAAAHAARARRLPRA